ncbi:MAG: AraC family transcriptional regulator [Polyangiaceae bacterium]|nr:AraC family transcriptional regulator [Polyangiaceae bacterium]
MRVERFPDGSASLLFRALGAGRGDVSVAGPRTRALFKNAPPSELAIAVQFKPGSALPVFGIPVNELTDRIVRLEAVWGDAAQPLLDAMLETSDTKTILRALEAALLARSRRTGESTSATLARRAARLIADRVQSTPMNDLAAELGVTARHLRRAFVETVGVGPKEFARMMRLQRVLRVADTPNRSWSALAVEAGYYDQAHLIGEFRALVGTTPAAFSKREPAPSLRW